MTRQSTCVLLLLLGALTVPLSFGAKDDKANATGTQGVLLDENEFPCDNCLFGMSDYYFCFEVSDKILIGHDKVRGQMHHQNPAGLLERGRSFPLRYNADYIWIDVPNAKEIKLKQDYKTRIFIKNSKCQAATR